MVPESFDKPKYLLDIIKGKSPYIAMITVIGFCLISLTLTVAFLPKLGLVSRFFFKDINALPVNNSNPDEGIPSVATQVEVNSEAAAPVTDESDAPPLAETVEAAPALPPEGIWLVTPESGTTCDSSMSPNITPPFNVTVSYDDGDATTLVVHHPEGVTIMDQQETSPNIIYRGEDIVAQYELVYNPSDGSMSITETFTIGGNGCVVLHGSMEYQGPG